MTLQPLSIYIQYPTLQLQAELELHSCVAPRYTTLDDTALNYTTTHENTQHNSTRPYIRLHQIHHITIENASTLHQLHYHASTRTPLHHTTLRYNYTYCTTSHSIQQLQVCEVTTATTPKKTQLKPPLGPSVDSLCHPHITTTHLSYSFLSLKLPPPPCAVLLVLDVIPRYVLCYILNSKHWCTRNDSAIYIVRFWGFVGMVLAFFASCPLSLLYSAGFLFRFEPFVFLFRLLWTNLCLDFENGNNLFRPTNCEIHFVQCIVLRFDWAIEKRSRFAYSQTGSRSACSIHPWTNHPLGRLRSMSRHVCAFVVCVPVKFDFGIGSTITSPATARKPRCKMESLTNLTNVPLIAVH